MGLIHIELFATLDLVGQAPGGPDEDPAGFPFGGWQARLLDEVTGAQVGAAYQGTDALLLGRRTMTFSPPTDRTRRVARTTRSPRCSTGSPGTWPPAVGPPCRGQGLRSSAR